MNWNRNISQAPRDRKVILATKCGKVTASRWLENDGRWLMLATGERPVAWQEWPEYPDTETNSQSAVTLSPADEPEAVSPSHPAASGTLSDDGIPAFLKREVA